MKKQSSLSKAEMKKVIGGGPAHPQSCTLQCPGQYTMQVSSCNPIDVLIPFCIADLICTC